MNVIHTTTNTDDAQTDLTEPFDGPAARLRAPRLRTSSVVAGGVLVACIVAGGALFWGVPPVTSGDRLPDPEAMAVLGDDRNTSAENVAFWSGRVAANPTSPGLLTQLAGAQLELAGDTGDLAGYGVAEQTASAAVELDPTHEGARLVLAAALAGQHDFAGALSIVDGLLGEQPDSISALLASGDALLELGQYDEARARYEQVSALIGGEPAVLSRFARLESSTGEPSASTALARDALVGAGDLDLRHADAAFYWFQLATYEFNAGDYGAADTNVRNALRIDPENGAATELLGKVLVAQGGFDEATALYEAMVEGGGAADLHGELAKLYERAGRGAAAQAQIDAGLVVAVRDADLYPAERRHLIGFLADHDPSEALRLAELDLAERQDVHSHAWYAWALYRTGDVDAAAEAIRPALVYRTQDARLMYQAGTILHAAGEVEEGRELLAEALALSPQFDLVHAEVARATLASE